ncbi:circadian clock-controlled protein daywake-like [Leguminivora glycinivorella]|uniref:circadian clock-controlled protein daywake-like n=1 Tax=Leguminivora glycinivorella TaxID=1035111 RepID=UPI00200CFC01|nr:circadian clock-controlled protein daywake-like [Leguminivora glycinivorella]
MFVNFIVIFAVLGLVRSSAVPITKCKSDDSECIKKNTEVLVPLFTAGIPELGIEQLDPVTFKKIDSSNNFLNLVFKDITVKGLSSCRFKSIKNNKAKHVINARIHCDVVLDGQYTMKGTVFLLPVTGDGKAHIEHKKIEINFDLNYEEETGADGKQHWKTGQWVHDFKYLGKNVLEFDNLFGGNEVLAQATKELMKNNPKELAELMAAPVVKTIVARIIKNLKIFFDAIPVEEFALD